MDMEATKMKRKLSENPSYLLAKEAMKELRKCGETHVVCPKCKKHPRMWDSEHGERTYVACDCYSIYMEEINL